MALKKVLQAIGSIVESPSALDHFLRNLVVVLIAGYVLLKGSVFEASYPHAVVELYDHPWWRLMVVLLLAVGTWWCPRVGLVLGIAVYLYLNDMDLLTTRPLEKQNAV